LVAGHITAGTAILRITGAIQLDVSVGAAGHRITTTLLAAVREAAHSDPHPVAVDRLEALVDGHRLVVEEPGHLVVALAHRPHAHHLAEVPGHPEAALADQPHARHLAVEAPGHPVEALAPHRPRAHRLVVALLARQQAVALAHPEQAAPARLDRAHHPVALVLRGHHLAEAQPAQEAARAQAVEASSAGGAAAHVRVAAASLVVVAADAARVGLVDLEAAGDDRFSLCNWRRLGFHHAAQQWV
jgi:hypothetical protein